MKRKKLITNTERNYQNFIIWTFAYVMEAKKILIRKLKSFHKL